MAELAQRFEHARPGQASARAGLIAHDVWACQSVTHKPYKVEHVVWRWEWARPAAVVVFSQDQPGSALGKLVEDVETLARCCPLRSVLVLLGEELENSEATYVRYARESRSPAGLARVVVGLGEFATWVVSGKMHMDDTPGLPFAGRA